MAALLEEKQTHSSIIVVRLQILYSLRNFSPTQKKKKNTGVFCHQCILETSILKFQVIESHFSKS